MNDDRRIQDYIHNRLSAKEKERFEQAVNEDETLKKDYSEHKAIHNAFLLHEAERLKSKLKSYENKNLKSSTSRLKDPLFLAIAASILVVVGLTYYFNYFQQNLYEQYFEPYPNVYQPIVRGNTTQSTKAFMYYENQNYTMAQDALEDLLVVDDNPSLRFYYGLSFLNNNQTEKAITEFNKIKDVDFEFKAELYWYMALAQLKLKNKNEAKNFLENLKTHFPDFKTDGVKDLLNSL